MKIKTIVIELENGSEFRSSGHSLEDSRKFIDRIFEIAGYKSDYISDVSDIKPPVLDVNLSWERGDPHHTIEVFNNGTLMASGWLVKKHDK